MTLEHMREHLDIFICPACKAELEIIDDEIRCLKCHNVYEVKEGIPLFFYPSQLDNTKKDVTDIVKSFYEKTPFPDYDNIDSVGSLIDKAQQSVFARLLDEQLPFDTRILEVGCGTGQMSNFLGITHRFVFGSDMCLNSLKLANDFKKRNNLKRVGFYQMNLFRPIFREESFHLLICSGVLHHTSNPFLGFKTISRLVKKGGYIIIGLYNKYGRFSTDIKRIIFNLFGNRFFFLDYQLRRTDRGITKKHAWFLDQYKNPHESKHTYAEVLKWFDHSGFDFINSIPNMKPFVPISKNGMLFKPNQKAGLFERFLVQSTLLFRGSSEGGLFLMIAKRKDE